ncbi:MAG: glycosyl hydrolase [Bacteroidetes bacterium]|nr:glycosyl hydrolase [Bacteroidota bacterium]
MKNPLRQLTLIMIFTLLAFPSFAQDEDEADDTKKSSLTSSLLGGLKFRGIGPALPSGRIIDFAVNPGNHAEYYVAVASGGVWKTTNDGITFTPIFDTQPSYSIGCITLDPNNPHTVWVGTGENNSQRSVSWGDGIYRSTDGGKSWKNMGLRKSEHIGKILIDPTDSRIMYVAAQGPLWGPGGDRGLYASTDAGHTWNPVLTISENTGVTDVVMDPRDTNVLYAASYQRRRHVWTLINGGPESRMYKSTDGGSSWDTLRTGLPSGDIGRIGLAISPVHPDYVYAIIEAEEGKGGVYRSTDRGASWEKRSDYQSVSAQYYNELVCDPLDVDKVYSLDTYTRVSDDGFKTNRHLGNRHRHVDDHALWINPDDPQHLLIGGDGGVYDSYDGGAHWRFKPNLPVTQFYRVSVDNNIPFYYVYGGTQDNQSLGGPSRTINADGIFSEDWFYTRGGDGYETQVDPFDPNIIYAQSQYGGLVRFDRRSGESLGIQPQPGPDEEPYRWNWDSPLQLSPHSPTRLYFAANVVFRSDDRGESWKVISPDLTRQIDRNTLPVMGIVWSPEAVAKNASTSLYGNIVSLAESPLKEGLLYVGTDDGLIQVTEDAGGSWRKIDRIPGVPERTYVSFLHPSYHDENTVYASFDNHKMADFAPYVMKSTDRGRTWTSISSDLPDGHTVYHITEDHLDDQLLFAGTEYGVFTSTDGGKRWVQLKQGVPTIAVRDIAIQQRENDLVLGTFGRGIYILDDYSPLRSINDSLLNTEAHLFPVKDALMYIEARHRGIGSQGETFFTAPNPPVGATFTYFLKESIKTRKEQRKAEEKKLRKQGKTPPYPDWEILRAEDNEIAPFLQFTIRDTQGGVVRKLQAAPKKGVHRLVWDLRYAGRTPVGKNTKVNEADALLAMPGRYTVEMAKVVDGVETMLAGPVPFTAHVLLNGTLPAMDRQALVDFQQRVAEIQRSALGAQRYAAEVTERLQVIEKALQITPEATSDLTGQWIHLRDRMLAVDRRLNGDNTIGNRNGNQLPSIVGRIQYLMYFIWRSTSAPAAQHEREAERATAELLPVLEELRMIGDVELRNLERELEQRRAPWTPGRIPELR